MQKKTSIQLGIIAVMVAVLIFLSMSLVPRKKNVPKPAPGAPAASQGAVKKPAIGMGLRESVIKIKTMKDDKFYAKFVGVADALPLQRDPFSFTGTGPRSSRDNLELTGILWEADKPTAIIDQTFLNAGSSIGQFTVVMILQDRVVLKDDKGEFELRLK